MAKSKHGSMRDKARKNAEKNKQGGMAIVLPDGIELYEVKAGKRSSGDILPYIVTTKRHPDEVKAGDIWYKFPYKLHFGVGIDNQAVICPRSIAKPCPICEEKNRMAKDPDADEDTVKDLKPQDRVLYNWRPIRKEKSGDIMIWDIPFHNFQKMLDREILDGDDEWGGFADLEDGFSLRIRFAEESFGGSKFAKADRIDFVSREDLKESILKKTVSLDECVVVLPYKEIQALFFQVDNDDDDDPDDKDPDDVDPDDGSGDDPDDKDPDGDDKDSSDDDKDPDEMDKDELLDYIDAKDLEIEKADDMTLKKLRRAVARAIEAKKKDDGNGGDDEDCPHGHTFGDDCDKEKECDGCKAWDKCFDAQE